MIDFLYFIAQIIYIFFKIFYLIFNFLTLF